MWILLVLFNLVCEISRGLFVGWCARVWDMFTGWLEVADVAAGGCGNVDNAAAEISPGVLEKRVREVAVENAVVMNCSGCVELERAYILEASSALAESVGETLKAGVGFCEELLGCTCRGGVGECDKSPSFALHSPNEG